MILLDFRPNEKHDICMFVKVYFVKYLIKAPPNFAYYWMISEGESRTRASLENPAQKRKKSLNDELVEKVCGHFTPTHSL
jgi:hypothetical protein